MTRDGAAAMGVLGRTVRVARRKQRLTLEELAENAGVSKSVLSQVERGSTNPTLSTLWNIASALKLDPVKLFGGTRPPVRTRERSVEIIETVDDPIIEGEKYTLVILNRPELAGLTELYRAKFRPGGLLDSRPHEPGAVEQITVLKGEVEIHSDAEKLRVRAGATARYPADVRHSIAAVGGRSADVIIFVVFSKNPALHYTGIPA